MKNPDFCASVQGDLQGRMRRYPVVRGRETPGFRKRNAVTLPRVAVQMAQTDDLSPVAAPASVSSVGSSAGYCEAAVRRWRSRGLRNVALLRAIASNKFDTGISAFDGITKRRLEEMAYISRELPRFYCGKVHGARFRCIGTKLDGCSPRRPSGSMLSFLIRHVREREDFEWVRAAFSHVPTRQIFLESKLVKLISGTVGSLPMEAKKAVEEDRKRNRNHIQHFMEDVDQYRNLMAYKVYEFECYRSDDLKRVYKLFLSGELPASERTAEGEVWADFLAWSRGRNPPKISRRKIETLLAMGWDPTSDEDVWLVHSHALIRVQNPDEYYRLQKDSLYTLNYQVVLTGLRSTKSRDENIRDIIRYLLKATPRYGALFSDRKQQNYLSGVALKRFIALYDELGYQGVKAHFGMPTKRRA